MSITLCEKELKSKFEELDEIAFLNQKKVLKAFQECKITTQHFAGTTGYGYSDMGREGLSKLYSKVFNTENAIVSPLITCGSHAISIVLYGLLRPGDELLSISGSLYDTLGETIFGKGNGSLEDYNVKYKQIELNGDDFDDKKIIEVVKKDKPKVIFVQRSRGYSSRKALSCEKMGEIFSKIRQIYKDGFIVVDNCYGEFVETKEPTDVGADVIVGSLIKNPGGGLAQTGGYIAGTANAIDLVSKRFTSPSLGLEVGSFEMGYRNFYQGLFLAPHTVMQAIKGAYLIGKVMEKKGYKVIPASNENTFDIIKSIVFNTEEELVSFVQNIQKFSPVDSFVLPLPWDMPGYEDKVIMAAGTFVGGASIELSCDSPIKKPYIAYFQGGLTYEHVKLVAEELDKIFWKWWIVYPLFFYVKLFVVLFLFLA